VVVAALAAWALGCGGSGDSVFDENTGESGSEGSGNSGSAGLFGAGGSTSSSGSGASNNSGFCGSTFTGTVRDFQESHPDFEFIIEVDPGIVLPDLGSDGKPVYAGQDGNPTTNGQAAFDQWFRDVDGVNQAQALPITLIEGAGGVFTYDNPAFFPIDGAAFGNEGHPHNYHFTYELRTQFLYEGGEIFSFTGDDDLFTYINGKLVIDLGGVHGAMSQQVDLDSAAATLGITPGNVYSLDFFFAERHTSESNFRIDTTISFVDCGATPD
jgi:fibro-slime domain-containing protein